MTFPHSNVSLTFLQTREILMKSSSQAKQSIEEIESACFVVCLDSARPKTLAGMAKQVWHGDGVNRWFDKPVQFVVADDGQTGYVGEHAAADGGATRRLNEHIQESIRKASERHTGNTVDLKDYCRLVTALPFPITSELQEFVTTACSRFGNTMASEAITPLTFNLFGGEALYSKVKNTNTCVQLIMSLAAYRMYGEMKVTYEPVSLTTFADGRWTVCSMVIEEMLTFCQLANDPNTDRTTQLNALSAVLKAHGKNVSKTADGVKNTEAHLIALKKMLREGETIPEVFLDPIHQKPQSWFLSTTYLPSKYGHHYGCCQEVEDGIGLGHMIRDDQ